MTAPDGTGALIADLVAAGVATVYEATGRSGMLDVDLEPLLPGSRVAGPARTALCGHDDNRAVHEAIAKVEPGEVLVLTVPEPYPVALVGELLATQAQARGAAGMLVNAAVRDVAELRALGLPVWARWRRVRGTDKNIRGSVDVPVVVGGTYVAPGDIVLLDDDGAVAVPVDRLEEAARRSRERVERERELLVRWRKGELSYDVYGLRAEDERITGPA